MLNKLTKTLIIIVISSMTIQFEDFKVRKGTFSAGSLAKIFNPQDEITEGSFREKVVENVYNQILIECFRIHGETLQTAGNPVGGNIASHNEMYDYLEEIYVSSLGAYDFKFKTDDNNAQKNSFRTYLRKAYLWVPYHNICHAVMTMLHTESLITGLKEDDIPSNKEAASLLMGALLHDLAHPGFTSKNLDAYKDDKNNLKFLKKVQTDDGGKCELNTDVNMGALDDLFDYGQNAVQRATDVNSALNAIKLAFQNKIKLTDAYFEKNGNLNKDVQTDVTKGLNDVLSSLCDQAEMSHAVLAWIILDKTGLKEKFDLNYLLVSILMTNMNVHYYMNFVNMTITAARIHYKTRKDKIISSVHYADILNMAAHYLKLVIETGKQVGFEFNLEAHRPNAGVDFLKQTAEGFGNGQNSFNAVILGHFNEDKVEDDIFENNEFYQKKKQSLADIKQYYTQQTAANKNFEQGEYAQQKQQQFANVGKFPKAYFVI